jgi:hypothetical protein
METVAERQFDPSISVEAAQEAVIRPLLARGNLLRIRSQWEEAITVCTEALRLAPHSASAHSLLGDIYEAQGRLEDAAQWFEMAVDLAPDSPVDRAKLERVLEAQRIRLAAAPPVPPPLAPAPAAPKAATEKTLEWFDRVFPPGRADSIARLIFAMCGGLALLLALSAGFLYLSAQRGETNAATGEGAGLAPIAIPGASNFGLPAVVMTPTTPSSPDAARPTPKPTRPAATVAASSSGQAAATSTPPTASDEALRGRIAALLPPGVAVTAVSVVGTASSAFLSLDVAIPAANETREQTRERVVRAAAVALHTAANGAPGAGRVVVRVSVRSQDARHTTAFTAEGVPAALHNVNLASAPMSELLSRFRSLQWAPGLMPDGGATATAPSPVPSAPASPTAPTPAPSPSPTASPEAVAPAALTMS